MAAAEQQRLAELEAMRDDADALLQAKAVAAKSLKAEVETLRKAEAKRRKEIEKLTIRRSQIEAEAREREQQEISLLTELETVRARVESNEQDWLERELSIRAQIEALRKAETVQLKRIEKVAARLQPKVRNGKSAKASVKPAAKSRRATEVRETTETPDRMALLEAIRGETELELQSWSEKEQQIQTELQALCKAEQEQIQRIEEARLRLRSQEDKLQARTAEEVLLLAETDNANAVSANPGSAGILPAVSQIAVAQVQTEEVNEEEIRAGCPRSQEESLQPLETWQFAVTDNETRDIELHSEEVLAIAGETQVEQSNDNAQTLVEEPEFELELSEFDLQSELSQLATEASSFLTSAGDDHSESREEFELNCDDWTASVVVESFEGSETSPRVESSQATFAGSTDATLVHEAANDAASEKSVDLHQADAFQTDNGIEAAGETQTRPAFVADLTSNDASKRERALHDLAQLDENEAFGLIAGLFDDASPDVRNAAARALYEFRPDRAASFTRALRDGSPQLRRHIAAALDGSGLATEAIDNLVGEGREKTYDAFSLLFLMAKAGEVQSLLQTIEKHPDVAVRLSVIRLLTFSNQPDIIPAFRSLAVRGSLPTEVRSAVMEAIYQISSNARENSRSAA